MVYEFPSDFKRLINNLHNDLQWRILEYLIKGEIKHGKLREILNVNEGILLRETKELQKGGWIIRISPKGVSFEHDDSIVYKISKFGENLLNGALKTAYIK